MHSCANLPGIGTPSDDNWALQALIDGQHKGLSGEITAPKWPEAYKLMVTLLMAQASDNAVASGEPNAD